ncbi:uncharacterized protein LOC129746838 [Uranotaenia lowii]|uniref:uncharacterized protein LOC129746838 n=1 Tax=Uranotaenia lowii TaxID=190385 RepID=UPI002479E101|nr:uncharacterized protein LOC129746838 [Uranotaenia lowii]
MSEEDKMISLRSNSITRAKPKSSDMTVTELSNLMKTQFETYQRSTRDEIMRLGEKFTSQIHQIRQELTSDIQKIREEGIVTTNKLEASIAGLKLENIQTIDRLQRNNDLIVSGIPFVQGENLLLYFATICRSLDYAEDVCPIVDIRRLSKGHPKSGSPLLILMQFAIHVQRNEFYSRYLKSRSLSLNDLGFAVNKRIYINENLSPAARETRSKALLLKRSGALHAVYTRDGIVYVKFKVEDREMSIAVPPGNNIEELIKTNTLSK